MAGERDGDGKAGARRALWAAVGVAVALGAVVVLAARRFADVVTPPGNGEGGASWGLPSDDHVDRARGEGEPA